MSEKILVCGAAGYVGSRLVRQLLLDGADVRAVSKRPVCDWPDAPIDGDCLSVDLRDADACERVMEGVSHVYNLATSVGGIGFVKSNNSAAFVNSLINTNLLRAAAREGVERYFFASSSCVYPAGINRPLKESDAHPASPMGGYGWEKLFSEQACLAFARERQLPVTIARYHGIYGPGDVRATGRDHFVTALAKKVVLAKRSGQHEISVWGDGKQTRSLLYIDDCVEGTIALMERGVEGPVNLANSASVEVEEIICVLENLAEIELKRKYVLDAPVGCQHKTSDNTLLRASLGWEPETAFAWGVRQVYESELTR